MPENSEPNPLPEKVLQFGTGILLRGLPDYFINKANHQGQFGGRIAIIKSTAGGIEDFEKQNFRFTTCVRGIVNGKKIEENIDNTAISRVLRAWDDWPSILKLASQPELQIIISNTTEVGIQSEPESILERAPHSFPAKVTALLYERFKQLGSQSADVVVIPTELVPDNGMLLKNIVLQLSAYNKLKGVFEQWLSEKILFCNSLVDRIVTRPSETVKGTLNDFNSLTIQAEPYKLWAIEGGERVRKILTFAPADRGVIIAENIAYYRERKIRLLNGTHTISVCLGFLQGFETVYDCMQDKAMSAFIQDVMLQEIEPTLLLGTKSQNRQFALDVLDRFRNPFTAHRLLSITLQATAKMKMRNVPTFFSYAAKFRTVPDLLAKGFAAYLLFMRATHYEKGSYFGSRRGEPYLIQDDQSAFFYQAWKNVQPGEASLQNFVRDVCQNTTLWDKDLTQLPNFVEAVSKHLQHVMSTTRQ